MTGNHFAKKYGSTFRNIKKDGFQIFKSLKLDLEEDTIENVILNIGKFLVKV